MEEVKNSNRKQNWYELIKKYLLSGGKDLASFKQSITLLKKLKEQKNPLLIDKFIESLEILYEIGEKNTKKIYDKMISENKVVECIENLNKKNLKGEALFLQALYMFFNFGFQTKGGRFTSEYIQYKPKMKKEELIDELINHEKNAYTLAQSFIWLHDDELIKLARSFLVITFESIRAIYIELDLKNEAIELYKRFHEWLENKPVSTWKDEFQVVIYSGKAEVYAKILDFDKAIKYFNKAVDQIKQFPINDDLLLKRINVIANISTMEKMKRNYYKAKSHLEEALELIELLENKKTINYKAQIAQLKHQIANCHFELKEHKLAYSIYFESYSLFLQLLSKSNPIIFEEYIRLCLDKANNHHKLQDIKEAIDLLEKVLDDLDVFDKYKIRNTDTLHLEIKLQISKYYQETNEHDKVKALLEESEDLVKKQDKTKTIQDTKLYEAFRHLGIQFREYNLEKSNFYFKKAIKYFENQIPEDKKPLFYDHYLATLHEYGSILQQEYNFKAAEEYYTKAVNLQMEVVKSKPYFAAELALYLSNLGKNYLFLKKYHLAKPTLKYAIEIRKKLTKLNAESSKNKEPDRIHTQTLFNTFNDLGMYYLQIREFELASSVLEKAYDILYKRKIDKVLTYETEIYANIIANLSRAKLNLGDIKQASIYNEKALQIRKALFQTHPEKFIRKIISDYYLKYLIKHISNDINEAIQTCNEALDLLKNIELEDLEIARIFKKEIEKDISIIKSEDNMESLCNTSFNSIYGKFERIIIMAKEDRLINKSELENQLESKISLYLEENIIDNASFNEIYSLIEQMRFENFEMLYSFNEFIIDSEIEGNIDHLRNEIAKKRKTRREMQLSLEKKTNEDLKEYLEKLNQLYNIELECIELYSKLVFQISKPYNVFNNQDLIANYLDKYKDEVILTITLANENLVFALFASDKMIFEVGNLDFLRNGWHLTDLYYRYNEAVDDKKLRELIQEEIIEVGKNLWNELPEDIRLELSTADRIALSVSKNLELIPFELLYHENFLGLEKIIIRIFSPTTYTLKDSFENKRDNNKRHNFLLVSEPNKLDEEKIAKAEEEISFISNLLPKKFGSKIQKSVFTENNALKQPIIDLLSNSENSIIHFTCHGEKDKIWLSDNQYISSLDLIDNYLDFGNSLVYLNICNTGYFNYYNDMILKGFVPNILKTSTGAVIASLNRIEDTNSNNLSQFFYTEFIKGLDVGEALKEARIKSYNSTKEFDKIEWANLRLFGNSRLKVI